MKGTGFDALKTEVIECDLCTRCGTCIGICPVNTLSYTKEKITNTDNRCIQCGMCRDVCPGKEFSFPEWSEKLFEKSYDTGKLFGAYQSIWNAYAKEEKIRHIGSSGGVITQLLLFLLEKNVVEGVVGVRRKKNSPCEFESFIAKNREQIIEAAQSKYVMLPVNQVIRDIKKSGKKVAYVGLPCQIHGMRKAMDKNVWLKEQVVVLLAPFCGFNMEYEATDYLIAKSKIRKENIEYISYRYKRGNDTGFYIKEKNGGEFFVNKHGYTFLNLLFSPKRCWKCFDYSGEFADISVGDAWEKGQGFSRVIVRTDTGKQLFDAVKGQGIIYAESADEKAIIKTQNKVVTYKKKQIAVRAKQMKSFPEYGLEFDKVSQKIQIKGVLLYFILAFFKTSVGRCAIRILPFQQLVKISGKIKGREVTQIEN
ncbi:MAG: Coenzyme F420 hydrogenase/dehydrogenase, beta subunit C-terminal domain [Clostridium sp.]|nr:Coenzyme F420 hydrogenase/dehydrogenase, beta subunit C-terminal domain [Clostridium sp.]